MSGSRAHLLVSPGIQGHGSEVEGEYAISRNHRLSPTGVARTDPTTPNKFTVSNH